jgi:glycosidase
MHDASTARRPGRKPGTPPWYLTANVVEIRLAAWRGDLRGLAASIAQPGPNPLDGFDAIHLAPFYPNGGADGGYDVIHHTAIDRTLGTLDDFDALIKVCNARSIRVIVDIVPCHRSTKSEEFEMSRRDPGGGHGDWFHWHHPDDGPFPFVSYPHGVAQEDKRTVTNLLADPTSGMWVTDVDGHNVRTQCWHFDPIRGAYYFGRFKPSQPALNFGNPAVLEHTKEILRFWLARGVSGFRVDVPHFIAQEDGTSCEGLERGRELFRELVATVRERGGEDVMILGEDDLPGRASYDEGRGFTNAFAFPLQAARYVAHATRRPWRFLEPLVELSPPPNGFADVVFRGCHDDVRGRHLPRLEQQLLRAYYGDGRRGRRFVDDAVVGGWRDLLDADRAAMERWWLEDYFLPGAKYTYYRDLLALGHDRSVLADRPDGDLRWAVRGPLPWTGPDSVEEQLGDPRSWLHFVRRVNAFYATHPALAIGEFDLLEVEDQPNQPVWGCVRRLGDDVVLGAFSADGDNPRQFAARLPADLADRFAGARLLDWSCGQVHRLDRDRLTIPLARHGHFVATVRH